MGFFYFAYGSNLNTKRMVERGVRYSYRMEAKLEDYELRFNKVSKKQGAVANVMPCEGSVVEGVLYHVEDIKQLDKFEGYPKHYDRVVLRLGEYNAWVYIAQPQYIQEGLKPKQEYLNHLLEGKQFLSDGYYEKLMMINESL